MLKKTNYAKRTAAILSASVLALSGATSVLAADTYVDLEKKNIAALGESLGESLERGAQQKESFGNNVGADLTLRLEDAGRSVLGMLSPEDISWLDTISMAMDISIKDGIEAENMDIFLNEEYLTNLSMFIDFMSPSEYIRFTDFSDSWLWVPLTMGESGEEAAEISTEMMGWLGRYAEDPYGVLPNSPETKELLTKYGDLILDNMQEGPSVEESVSVEGIGQDCTVYEGQIYQKDVLSMAENILTTAKEDEVLKKLIEAGADSGDVYAQFTAALDELLEGLKEGDAGEVDETSYISSKIWVDSEGKIVGRQISVCEGVESNPIVTWKNPSEGDRSALLLEIGDDQSSEIALTGTGTTADGMMSGAYEVLIDSVPCAVIEMENYDLEAAKTGYPNGRFVLSFPASEGGSTEENILANFALVLNIVSDEAVEKCSFELSLTSANVPLATLILNGRKGEEVELPDLNALGTVYDMTSESDMESYIGELNWNSLLDNAGKAGVPEELVSLLDGAIQQMLTDAEGEGVEE